jgi:hypothetical protein
MKPANWIQKTSTKTRMRTAKHKPHYDAATSMLDVERWAFSADLITSCIVRR